LAGVGGILKNEQFRARVKSEKEIRDIEAKSGHHMLSYNHDEQAMGSFYGHVFTFVKSDGDRWYRIKPTEQDIEMFRNKTRESLSYWQFSIDWLKPLDLDIFI
jgi:hypothetical protein